MVRVLLVLGCGLLLSACQTTSSIKHYSEIACNNKQHIHAALEAYAPADQTWVEQVEDAIDIICAMILPESN